MMDNECIYCNEEFENGQNIMMYEYDFGTLYFCCSICAGNWFVDSECQSVTFTKDV